MKPYKFEFIPAYALKDVLQEQERLLKDLSLKVEITSVLMMGQKYFRIKYFTYDK